MQCDVGDVFRFLYWLNALAAVWITFRVVLGNRNPVATFAWIFVLLFLPYIGLVLYFFFGRDTRKLKYIKRRYASKLKQRAFTMCRPRIGCEIPDEYSSLSSYMQNAAESYPMSGSEVDVIPRCTLFIEQLLAAIDNAREHIHLQFYIFEDDKVGYRLREALMAKARQGIEVRVLYDSVGCWSVKPAFYDEIRRAGGYVESFLKVRFPLFTNKVNYRNHRKVVVIDGNVGFVGGCNIADRYIDGIRGGTWRDTMLCVRGSAVYGLQASFLADWFFANGTMLGGQRYFPIAQSIGTATVQVLVSNPVGMWHPVSGALTAALATVRKYVYLQTPYFMPNENVLAALQNVALSGADVRLMIPERSDNRIVDYASYSFLGALLRAGVKVYLYQDGFLHAKTFVADDMLSVVGSANLDFRSFDYNFEVCAYVYDADVAARNKSLFLDDVTHCRQLQWSEYNKRSLGQRCMESVARLFSPIL